MSWDVLVDFARREYPSLVAEWVGVPAAELDAFERVHGIQLPAAYRAFLMAMGREHGEIFPFGRRLDPNFDRLGGPRGRYLRITTAADDGDLGGPDYYLDLQRDGALVVYEDSADVVPDDLPIEPLGLVATVAKRLFAYLTAGPHRAIGAAPVSVDTAARFCAELGFVPALPLLAGLRCLRHGVDAATVTTGVGCAVVELACVDAGSLRAIGQRFRARFPGSVFELHVPSPAPAPRTVETPPVPRDAALEAALAADPSPANRAVYADWLSERGHPWGDVLALYHAGRADEARELLDLHRSVLAGGLDTTTGLAWDRGFIDEIRIVSLASNPGAALYAKVRAAPAGLLLRSLIMPGPAEPALVDAIVADPPLHLRHIFVHLDREVARLDVEHLALFLSQPPEAGLEALLARAPSRLRYLELLTFPGRQQAQVLSAALVEKLVTSPVVRRLDGLALYQRAIDGPGGEVVLAHADQLAHLAYVRVECADPLVQARLTEAFGARGLSGGPSWRRPKV